MSLIGQRFKRLIVLKDVGRSKDRSILYLCSCDCGNEKIIKSKTLRSGESTSCGCYAKEMRRLALQTVKIGDKFGNLEIIGYDGSNGKKASVWECKCSCGRIINTTTNHLTTGNTKSCGCSRKGELHFKWDFTKTSEERKIRRRINGYSEWRSGVFKRDNYKCVLCESKENINAHHVESYSKNILLRTNINNGITLCKRCHIRFHKKYSYQNNTKNQFEEFINA